MCDVLELNQSAVANNGLCSNASKVRWKKYLQVCAKQGNYTFKSTGEKDVKVQVMVLWMKDDLLFYVLFNSISVISGQWTDENQRLCAVEFRLRLRKFRQISIPALYPLNFWGSICLG